MGNRELITPVEFVKLDGGFTAKYNDDVVTVGLFVNGDYVNLYGKTVYKVGKHDKIIEVVNPV